MPLPLTIRHNLARRNGMTIVKDAKAQHIGTRRAQNLAERLAHPATFQGRLSSFEETMQYGQDRNGHRKEQLWQR
jgi:hypothetical protein